MNPRKFAVALTTNGSGAATGYTDCFSGVISAIRYVKTDFADGVTFAVTVEDTGETIWSEATVNASATRAPRQATHTTAGAASLYAAAGTAVNAPIVVAFSRVKVVISSGGSAKTGTVYVVVT